MATYMPKRKRVDPTLPCDVQQLINTSRKLNNRFMKLVIKFHRHSLYKAEENVYEFARAAAQVESLLTVHSIGSVQAENLARLVHVLWVPQFQKDYSALDGKFKARGNDIRDKLQKFLNIALWRAHNPNPVPLRSIPKCRSILKESHL